jgi:hypothetical protein
MHESNLMRCWLNGADLFCIEVGQKSQGRARRLQS